MACTSAHGADRAFGLLDIATSCKVPCPDLNQCICGWQVFSEGSNQLGTGSGRNITLFAVKKASAISLDPNIW